MEHKPSSIMTDRTGQFQRCWDCGARRKVARFGTGIWDKAGHGEPIFYRTVNRTMSKTILTKQELIDELFKQT